MRTARTVLFWSVAGALLAAHLLVAWNSLFVARLWEDEAFNLTVPLNLLAGLGYTSDGTLSGSTLTPFDPRISTGASVLLPVTGVIATGIDPVIGGRLVCLGYWGLLLAGLWIIGRRIAGRWAALVAVAVPLAFNSTSGFSPIQGPADLLGEIPAAALLVWALIVLPRRAWLAGLLVGLAIQAKLIALLALPAFAVALWAITPGHGWRRIRMTFRRALLPLGLAALPTVLVELAAFVTFGPTADYVRHARAFAGFFRSGGQDYAPTTVVEKLGTLADSWFVPAWAAVLIALATLALTLGGLWVTRRRETAVPQGVLTLFWTAMVGAAAFIGWWATAAHTPLWVRHPAPGIFAFLPLLGVLAVWGARTLWGAPRGRASVVRTLVSILVAVVVVGLGAGIGIRVASEFSPRWETLPVQRAAVEPIRTWVQQTDAEWLAAEPWGGPVSAVVLSGAHVGLFDAPAMKDVPRLTTQGCAGEELVTGSGYRVCAAP